MSAPPRFPTARLLGFIGRLALIYTLLVLPWPGWSALYSRYFQALGRAAFVRDDGQRIVTFEPYQDPADPRLDARAIVSNRDRPGKKVYMPFDTRGIGWIPTALTASLILATAVPWRRRLWALFWGLFWVHLFILVSVGVHLWRNSDRVGLVTFSEWGLYIADGFDYTLVTQLGTSFSVPVLIWILVTFRRRDGLAAGA